jgi:hypothetical protein
MSDTPVPSPDAGNPVFNALQGRTTAFLVFFAIIGTVFHLLHRLDATYMSFVGLIMGFVLAHSVKDDIQTKAMAVLPKPSPILPDS